MKEYFKNQISAIEKIGKDFCYFYGKSDDKTIEIVKVLIKDIPKLKSEWEFDCWPSYKGNIPYLRKKKSK